MKLKMSVSVDKEKIKIIEKFVRSGIFRNKSHALENALDSLLKILKENKK